MISINQVGELIAKCLGDTKNFGEVAQRSFRHFKETIPHKPLVSMLSYQAYDPARKLFLNNDSIGFGFEILPLSGIDEDKMLRIVSMLNDKLPSDGDLHIQLFVSNKIGRFTERFATQRGKGSEIANVMAEQRANYLNQKANHSITAHTPFLARDIRCYLYYAQPIKNYAVEMQFDELCHLRDAWATSLSGLTYIEHISIDTFITVIYELLNPCQSVDWTKLAYRADESISHQVVNSAVAYAIESECLKVDAEDGIYQIQHFNVESLPEKHALWQMGECVGKLLDSNQQIVSPFAINLHLRAIDKADSQMRAQSQFMMNEKNAHSPLAKIMPSIRKKHQEWSMLREHLDGTQRLCKAYFSVTLFAKSENAAKDKIRMLELYNSNGFKLAVDKYLQAAGLWANLPFSMTSGLYEDMCYFERFRTMTVFNAVNLMPLMADTKGNPQSCGQIYLSRRGQIFNFNAHDNKDGNLNIAIAAKSRSGKSFMVQDMIADTLSRRGFARIIDIGGSYKKFCQLFGGQYIELSEKVCINPFTSVVNIHESLTQIVAIIAIMAHQNGDATDKEKALIQSAVKSAWAEKANQANISTVVKHLLAISDSIAQDLCLLLDRYTVNGQYGQYFEGKATLSMHAPLCVIDLEPLKSMPDLKSVVVLAIILQFNEEFYNSARDIPKMCVIDEAWDLLHSSREASMFMEAGYRRGSKHGVSFVTIFQSINDYFRNEMGIAIYENSDHQIIMAQKDETVANLKQNERLKLTPYEEQLVRSISGCDQYKECLIRTPQGSHLVRVVFEPFTRILYSSKGEHVERVQRCQNQGLSLAQAVMQVAREEFPNEY